MFSEFDFTDDYEYLRDYRVKAKGAIVNVYSYIDSHFQDEAFSIQFAIFAQDEYETAFRYMQQEDEHCYVKVTIED